MNEEEKEDFVSLKTLSFLTIMSKLFNWKFVGFIILFVMSLQASKQNLITTHQVDQIVPQENLVI